MIGRPSTAETMARPASDIADRLVDSALDHFVRFGVDAATLRAIARDAGTTAAMVTYHFGTKDGLFFAVLDRYYDPLVASLEAIASAESDPLQRLLALLGRIGAFDTNERRVALIVVREVTLESPRVPHLLQRFVAGHVRLLADAYHAAVVKGQLRSVPVFEVLPVLVGPFMLPQIVRLPSLLGVEPAAMAQTAVDVILNGLRTDVER